MQMKRLLILLISMLLVFSLTGIASADENTLTFVLGTSENQQALTNAGLTSDANILIYDYQSVPDLSNNSFVFLGSINDENLSISVNTSAVIYGYNMTNTSLINEKEDTNITKYWFYGGDDNIANMIDYMENQYLGYSSTYDEPEPPEDRINITYIAGASGVKVGLLSANDDLLISKYVRVNVVAALDELPSTLVTEDIIVLEMLTGTRASSAGALSTEAITQNSATVISLNSESTTGYSNVNTSSEEYATVQEFWDYKGEENLRRLSKFLAVTYKDAPMEIEDPVARTKYGFYHPDAPEIYQTADEYLEWYNSTGKYNPDNVTIGIMEYQVPTSTLTSKVEDALIEEIEANGCNAMFATFYSKNASSLEYFLPNGTPVVDTIISLRSYSLGADGAAVTPEKLLEYFEEVNVPVIHGINCYYDLQGATYQGSEAEWANSSLGLASDDIARNVVLQEFEGIFDTIILSWKNRNEDSVTYNVDPVEDHVHWLVARSINYAMLGETPNSEKKVAILYYNHGGGKNNFDAMYLDVPESLNNLVEAMNASGYDTGTEAIPNETELVEMMQLQGRNVGTWADGALESMVADGEVVLWPTEEYMKWFSTLPEENQDAMIDTWGEAPGEIMTYVNNSGSYFVIPVLEFGNVILGPQPTRGWSQSEEALYHDGELVPTHQYLAYYLWLQHEYEADAIMHFGTHGTQEWLPGKDVALSMYDWPAVMAGEVPIIYPYLMDDVGEGIQAKRRGSALIVDHLTSPIIEAGLYGGYENLSDYIDGYNDISNTETLKGVYRNLTIQEYDDLSIVDALGTDTDTLYNMTESEFDIFLEDYLEVYLLSLEVEAMPYGMHVIGENPPDEQTVGMIRLMLGDEYIDTVEAINSSENSSTLLLEEFLLNNVSINDSQDHILGTTDANVTAYLEQGATYYQSIQDCIQEIPNLLRALNGEYIEPGSGNDPIQNPDSLPTGINFYSIDARTLPGEAEWLAGMEVANQTLELYQDEHGEGEYPETISFIAFSTELIRNKGVTESEVLYLLGVEPAWNPKNGRIDLDGFTVIPESELGRPRIDILYVSSGLYRDMYPDKLEMIDYAVRLAANASNSTYPNYVKQHSETIYDQLIAQNYTEEDAKLLSESRVVSRESGVYGTGLEATISASETYTDEDGNVNESKLAELFINNLDNFYGVDIWDESNTEVFEAILSTVDVAVKSDSSNLLGLVDNDDAVSWLGGLSIAVRDLTGTTPDLYINNFADLSNLQTEKLSTVLSRELTTRYFNPSWITGMMESGFAGAREMDRFVEFLWMWEVTCPDVVTDSMWQNIYDTYILDENNLGLEEFFNENPYNKQSILAQMTEAIRTGYWDASDEVLQTLITEYAESVVNDGVTCCHHTCGNPLLDEFIQTQLSTLDSNLLKQYYEKMYEATLRESSVIQTETDSTTSSHDSLNSVQRAMLEDSSGSSNQSMVSDSGAGTNIETPAEDAAKSTADNYVEGYEMTSESTTQTESATGFSGSDIIASILVIAVLGAMYWGFVRKN